MPTDGVEFDTGDFGVENDSTEQDAAQPGTYYTPPTGTEFTSTGQDPDPEMGEGTIPAKTSPVAEEFGETNQATKIDQVVNLLENGPEISRSQSAREAGGLHELD